MSDIIKTAAESSQKPENETAAAAATTLESLTPTKTTTTATTTKAVRYNRIFKKTSQDGNFVLFLPQRELVISEKRVEPLMGVALVHQSVIHDNPLFKVFLQVVLMFRYGREDEELMGLRFCNEIVVAAEQIYPSAVDEAVLNSQRRQSNAAAATAANGNNAVKDDKESGSSSSSRVKLHTNSQGFVAIPFAVDMGRTIPPSVRLLPCRPYTGAPIGTTYEVQLFAGRSPDDLPKKRKMVQMSLRLYEKMDAEEASLAALAKPVMTLEKNFLLSENPLHASARLDAGIYAEGDKLNVSVQIARPGGGGHGVRKMKITAVQQVGVAMFSSGNFKNNVGFYSEHLDPLLSVYKTTIPIDIELSKDYSWVAMDETAKKDADIKYLAPTVIHASNKSMFIIRVQYYVQVTLCFGMLHRDISIRLPFLLRRIEERKLVTDQVAAAAVATEKAAQERNAQDLEEGQKLEGHKNSDVNATKNV